MSGISSYRKEKCSHPDCISGKSLANSQDKNCWLGEDDPKVFCSVACKKDFLRNIKKYKKIENLKQRVYSNYSRQKKKEEEKQEEVTNVIYLIVEPKVPKSGNVI